MMMMIWMTCWCLFREQEDLPHVRLTLYIRKDVWRSETLMRMTSDLTSVSHTITKTSWDFIWFINSCSSFWININTRICDSGGQREADRKCSDVTSCSHSLIRMKILHLLWMLVFPNVPNIIKCCQEIFKQLDRKNSKQTESDYIILKCMCVPPDRTETGNRARGAHDEQMEE